MDRAETLRGRTAQYCAFFVDDLYCGVAIDQVREVTRQLEITPVPLAPAGIQGLLNLRGRVVTAIDLRRRLGLPPREADAMATNVIVRVDGEDISLLVDEVDDVYDLALDAFEDAPQTVSANARRFLRGVYKFDSRLLLSLDVDRVLDFEELESTDETQS
jgi:purine-binding chemotaxis protein CheW